MVIRRGIEALKRVDVRMMCPAYPFRRLVNPFLSPAMRRWRKRPDSGRGSCMQHADRQFPSPENSSTSANSIYECTAVSPVSPILSRRRYVCAFQFIPPCRKIGARYPGIIPRRKSVPMKNDKLSCLSKRTNLLLLFRKCSDLLLHAMSIENSGSKLRLIGCN